MVGEEPRNAQERRGIRPNADIDQWLNQFREEFQNNVVDRNNLTQRFAQFLEEYQRREERRATLEQRVEHFRNEYAEAMTETAMSFINIRQEFQGRGAMFEQLHGLVNTHIMPNMDSLKAEQDNMGVPLTQLTQEHDQYSNDMGNSAARLYEAQEDLKGMLRTLAQQVEKLQGGTHPGSLQPDSTTPIVMIMNVEDLKRKATRFIESIDQNRAIDSLAPLREQVQHLEAKMENWQTRFPVRSVSDEVEDIQGNIELQADFEHVKQNDRRSMLGLRVAITNLKARVNLLRPRFPMESWEVVSDRVASEISRVSNSE